MRWPRRFFGVVIILVVFALYFAKEKWSREFIRLIDPTSISNLDFQLKEVSQDIGIQFEHSGFEVHPSLKNAAPWLSISGTSVAVTDYNLDGYQDLYFTNSSVGSKNHLYRNNKDGSFSEVAEIAGLARVNEKYPSTSSIFFDCDNNKTEDMVLLSFCPQFFKNVGEGKFKNYTKESGIGECVYAMGAINVLDYNNDGFLDVVIGGFYDTDIIKSPSSTHVMPTNMVSAETKSPIYLYENNGKCQFSKVETKIQSRGYSWAIGVYDFFNNGNKSVWIATDYGHDQLYEVLKNGEFVDRSQLVKTPTSSRNGMSVDFADIRNNGESYAYVSHIHSPNTRPSGNLLWKSKRGVELLPEVASQFDINRCGWSWGAKFLDLNNDSWQDLIVTNGFISNIKRGNDYWIHIMTISSGLDNMSSDATLWPPMGDFSLDGWQTGCVFLNTDDGLKDVADKTDFKLDQSDGRGVAYIDYMNNGSLSLVVANHRGRAKFYRNVQKNKNNWIGFDLEGVQSNRNAFGAKVELHINSDFVLTKELQPINGLSSQSDPRLHFGLKNHNSVQSVKIYWPNGKVQQLSEGQYEINSYNHVREKL